MRWRRVAVAVLAAVVALPAPLRADPRYPSVVFLLLDTTRADRFGAWGHDGDTTPVLDALARRGARFVRHYANSHATRPSMPQLMSGGYYRDNILSPFQVDAHPREMSFARRDPSPLLPAILGAAGFATAGVSAHTWVSPDSELGRAFDHLELLPFTAEEAHGDAAPLVDRALALWRARDPARPLFLYVHFMDTHIPRRLPEGAPLHPVPGYDWRARFRPNGEPAFDRARRGWDRYDASDFTAEDREHYAAVYDTRLHHADTQIGRLLAGIEADDPGLRHTVVMVTADHGEELGEDDRIEHPASLAEGVQHVPLIVAGGPVATGQRCDGLSEHVDVVPSLAALLGLGLPNAAVVDGTAWFEGGTLRGSCGRRTAFHAWEDYRAVRTPHYLLVEHPPNGIEARCHGAQQLYRVDALHRRLVTGSATERRRRSLGRVLHDRLDAPERRYRTGRYDVPPVPFLVRTDFWSVDPATALRCVTIDEETSKSALLEPGWFATGRGLALTALPADPVAVRVEVPPGTYAVDAATTPVAPAPWFRGVSRWRRRAFQSETPSEYVPLGTHDGTGGQLRVDLKADVLVRRHVLGIRLSPPGATPTTPGGVDREQEERLRALGYVQ
jgi:arylsulfatase A-like enzyme